MANAIALALNFHRRVVGRDGHSLVRAYVFETRPGAYYAMDAAALHADPGLLMPVAPAFTMVIYALELVALSLIVSGVVAAFLVTPWLLVPGVAGGLLMRRVNRRAAARMAETAIREHGRDFVYLYQSGLIWRL